MATSQWRIAFIALAIFLATFGSFTDAFASNRCNRIISDRQLLKTTIPPAHRAPSQLNAFPNFQSLLLAEGGLDAETLESLGDLQELNEALDGAIDAANPAIGILSKLVASPAFLAVPIGAGITVAFLIGYFIFSYGQGKDD